MIQHVAFFQLKDGIDEAKVQEMMRSSRSMLLKVPEVLSVKSGRNLDPDAEWPFTITIETDTMDKLRAALDDPYYFKLMESVIKPHATGWVSMDFELDPSKDLKYS